MIPSPLTPSEGWPQPLGAQVRDGGVNFVVFSEHASAIELMLFGSDGAQERQRWRLHGPHGGLWHGFVPGVGPGLEYGVRAHGAWAPHAGHRFNPHKLLLDPCAREIVGRFEHRPEHHAYVLGDSTDSFDRRDNAAWALKARVPAPAAPPPGLHAHPRHPSSSVVLYELHVKGFSMQLPGLPDDLRGTYAALAHPRAIAHFKALGVTTLSLLPVHYRLSEPMLPPGLVNHWGYNTIGFFCADPRFAMRPEDPAAVNAEFRAMVAALHEARLEVVLDVVFNHTPEGNHAGPSISFRGLDQASWYRLEPGGALANWSACGNTLNLAHPQVMRFVLDALRHWVLEMGVDGFRFDLAAVLGRGRDGAFDAEAAFFNALRADPVLAGVHLIAEPWDAGPEGYRVGHFPPPFLEWNDHFRDAVRALWLGHPSAAPARTLEALAGSPHTYRRHQRRPTASVNFITAHDGFTLADLTSHSRKHNHANGEDNRDGRDDELCAHFGMEGESHDASIVEARARVRRAMLATLALARGTPMFLAGDEFANSQQGNNNAWNQDNPIGWLAWPAADTPHELGMLLAEALRLRREEPLLHAADWQASWRLWPADLAQHTASAFGVLVAHDDHALLLAFNPLASAAPLPLPAGEWQLRLASSDPATLADPCRSQLTLPPRSLLLLKRSP
jgi:isoamylase